MEIELKISNIENGNEMGIDTLEREPGMGIKTSSIACVL